MARADRASRPTAVVLLSGGLDSAVALWWARKRGYRCHALTFDYGQRHRREMASARALARAAGVPLRRVRFRLPWEGSSLTRTGGRLPRHAVHAIGAGPIPSTYVPARNTIFLSFALSWADTIKAAAVVIGANVVDYSGYPDCRPAYLKAFERMGRLGTRSGAEGGRGVRILAPLLSLDKAQIVRLGERLNVPLEKTWSCYAGGRVPCGRCDACVLRERGFAGAKG